MSPVCLTNKHACLDSFHHPLRWRFYPQVLDARSRLDDALRVQAAAVPEGLKDHLVIIGAHPRLQYYVVAMRRQRPDVAIVVVTADKVIIFRLSLFFACGTACVRFEAVCWR